MSSSSDPKAKRSLSVFLCHSSGDKPAVRALYDRLAANNFEPWLDEKHILPGQDWHREITKMVKSSGVVIVCLSKGAVTKEGYIQREIKLALDVADEKPEGAVFIIPLRLEGCEIPERLSRWQWVNLFEEDGFAKLLCALNLCSDQAGSLFEEHSSSTELGSPLRKKSRTPPLHKSQLKADPTLVTRPFPQKDTILWVPRYAAVNPESHIPIVVMQDVLARANNHAAQSLKTEIGGFLLGNRFYCPNLLREYVVINDCWKASSNSISKGHIFSDEDWAELSRQLYDRFHSKLLVGWYHSHPRTNIFLSSLDVELHRQKFPESWAFALVLEPSKGLGGFFGWCNGNLSSTNEIGFYEYLHHRAKNSVIGWDNYVRGVIC